jgi:Domain of unknown function (DUF1906)
MSSYRSMRVLQLILALVSCGALATASGAPELARAAARPAERVALHAIWYRGYRFEVPVSWPVLNDVRDPATCVRFDLHAVYLGAPGPDEDCPSWLLGATEALLIQPASQASRRRATQNPIANTISATAPGIAVTATYGRDRGIIDQILASAGLPAAGPRTAASEASSAALAVANTFSRTSASQHRPGQHDRPQVIIGAAAPALPSLVTNDVGLGFDTCTAPSTRTMRAWRRHSRYRAVGIYIGGADRACAQRNLTASWVRAQAAAGWRFIPMYVGPQASFGQLRAPRRQGRAAARDAARQARQLDFGPETALYYDMEAYPARFARRTLRFLSAWTRTLHRLDFASGVYSSSGSAVVDLARHYRSRRFAMPNVIYDALWNGLANVSDRVYGRGEWRGRRRLHQFSGNVQQTHGRHRLAIDQDYLDLALGHRGGTRQSDAATVMSHDATYVFYRGGDSRLWEELQAGSGRWERINLGGDLSSSPSVVQAGDSGLTVLYRSARGELTVVRQVAGRWRAPQRLASMGTIGSAPRAVAQDNGVIDVFWSGYFDKHLWHAVYNPGGGWSGPQRLNGSMASPPAVVETAGGVVDVFWQGTNGALWRVVRRLGASWTAPQDLGMAPMGGAPQAVALPSGEIDIFWRGLTSPHHVWSATVRGGHVYGPASLGGAVADDAWPVYAAPTERVFFRAPGGRLWLLRRTGRRWSPPSRAQADGPLTAAPFAASDGSAGGLVVFWRGSGDRLWSRRYAAAGGWQQPQDLGGNVQ